MADKIVSLRELRENTGSYIDQIEKGQSFVVMRKSKPIFRLSPVDSDEGIWESVIDFTKFHPSGIPIDELLLKLKKSIKNNKA